METVGQPGESRLFRYVWRFNALAIAGAATTCIVLGFLAGLSIFNAQTRPHRVTNVVNVDQENKASEEFSLGNPSAIAGISYVQIPLFRGRRHGVGSIYSGGNQQTVNLLFLNISTNESRWLFDGVGQLILESHTLFNKLKDVNDTSFNKLREVSDPSRVAVAVVHVIVERDSDGDRRLTEKDVISLATSATDGTSYRKLIEGVDQIYSIKQIADDKVLILYQKNRETVSELYGIPSMAPLMRANVPKVKLN